jgi:hypothetical protein
MIKTRAAVIFLGVTTMAQRVVRPQVMHSAAIVLSTTALLLGSLLTRDGSKRHTPRPDQRLFPPILLIRFSKALRRTTGLKY